ncbi:hypothetical protein NIES4073_62360 [Kalymmatonema gypsitolerans NIES-4073]|nr:hypothetical protein NIES4073_62360 [Scytonema sp. NIES-4073]
MASQAESKGKHTAAHDETAGKKAADKNEADANKHSATKNEADANKHSADNHEELVVCQGKFAGSYSRV